ncbi:MAG TPA: hypothetical protein VFZ18_00245 [Longimicrobiaceae bacterium]
MRFVCLWSPRWSAGGAPLAELAAALLADAPRVAVEARGVIWADAHGLPASRLARTLLSRLDPADTGDVRAGVAGVPVAAELAARAGEEPVTLVESGYARAFLAPLPLTLLEPEPWLLPLLDGVGLTRCGELAALSREAVEVRLGAEGARLWRLARGDDPRPLFRPIPPERPHASLDFVDYQVTDAARLVFTSNALLGTVCDTLRERGERARTMALSLALGSGSILRRELRCSRPTAQRGPWLDRIRDELERLALPDTVTGVTLESLGEEPISATQGDLFDRGFATAGAVEEAVARLADTVGAVFLEPERSAHPLADARTRWRVREPEAVVGGGAGKGSAKPPGEAEPADAPCLALQLLPRPRAVGVRSRPRRDHQLPCAYREGRRWVEIVEAAGPDRVSGGHDTEAFAREYFRCATAEGKLLWLYRDGLTDEWRLHGWWD